MVGKTKAAKAVTNVVIKDPLKYEIQYLDPSYLATGNRRVENVLVLNKKLLIL